MRTSWDLFVLEDVILLDVAEMDRATVLPL